MTEIKDLALEVECIEDTKEGLEKLVKNLDSDAIKKKLLLDYPTVYIHNWKDSDKYEVYIGETNDIVKRTTQHLEESKNTNNTKVWEHQLSDKNDARLFIIGHELFNKSLTLDVENKMLQYMICIDKVKKAHNLRGNPQNKYYTEDQLNAVFSEIWEKLREKDESLFPSEKQIKDSAIFKASPLHKLTAEQEDAQNRILQKIFECLETNSEEHQLIFVEGEAGTGKTVLTSSTFYEIYREFEEKKILQSDGDKLPTSLKCCLMVNHEEQITVYKQIVEKLGLEYKYGKNIVCRPTTFINSSVSSKEPIDVAFIDEGHLLWTQGKQGYTGHNQLQDIIDRSKVTVVMFDENQILETTQYWEDKLLKKYRKLSDRQDNLIPLHQQLRIQASHEVVHWIDQFTKERKIDTIPRDNKYEIKIFDTPNEMDFEIEKKARDSKCSLSRLVATFDWEYSDKRRPPKNKYWEVSINGWHRPWNKEIKRYYNREDKIKTNYMAWAEQPSTIGEVGSTYSIQGFDLNYVGVILGPSVQYRNGEIVFVPSKSYKEKATQNRTLSDGSKKKFGTELLQHEVRVLMTRGINGLYIYAYDDALREALKSAAMV